MDVTRQAAELEAWLEWIDELQSEAEDYKPDKRDAHCAGFVAGIEYAQRSARLGTQEGGPKAALSAKDAALD